MKLLCQCPELKRCAPTQERAGALLLGRYRLSVKERSPLDVLVMLRGCGQRQSELVALEQRESATSAHGTSVGKGGRKRPFPVGDAVDAWRRATL